MIKFCTNNGGYLSIPTNSIEDLETEKELINLSIEQEKKLLKNKYERICNVLSNAIKGGEQN